MQPELRELLAERHPARSPTGATSTAASQRQRIWAIRDADLLARIGALLSATRCLLADGHHRYAAYLRLQQEHPGTAWDAGLAMLVDQDDTPLFLGAIHRTLPGATLDDLVQRRSRGGRRR